MRTPTNLFDLRRLIFDTMKKKPDHYRGFWLGYGDIRISFDSSHDHWFFEEEIEADIFKLKFILDTPGLIRDIKIENRIRDLLNHNTVE